MLGPDTDSKSNVEKLENKLRTQYEEDKRERDRIMKQQQSLGSSSEDDEKLVKGDDILKSAKPANNRFSQNLDRDQVRGILYTYKIKYLKSFTLHFNNHM